MELVLLVQTSKKVFDKLSARTVKQGRYLLGEKESFVVDTNQTEKENKIKLKNY